MVAEELNKIATFSQFVVIGVLIETEGIKTGFTSIVIPEDVTDAGEAHVALLVNTSETTSPLFNVELLKVLETAPGTSILFIFHWYEGKVPPFVIVEVNVTICPLHIVFPKLDAIETVGTAIGFTIIITGVEVALFGEAHTSDDTILTVTLSPLFSVEVENVGFIAPITSIPFILH